MPQKIDPKAIAGALKDKGKRRKILAVVLVIFLAIFGAMKIVNIETAKHIKLSGNIEGDEVRISFRVSSLIEELFVDEGSIIKIGDPLARLNTDELTQTRNEAKASLEAAKYQTDLAKIKYERAESLLASGSIPVQERDQAKTEYDADRSKVEQLTAQLTLCETRLGFADLKSPLNGYIIVKSALPGEVIQIGSPVFTAIDLNDVWVNAYLNEKDLGRVKIGQEARIRTDTYPDKDYKGTITFISEQAEFTPKQIQTTEERVKLVYRIKVKADNSSLELKPGMPADVYMEK